MLKSSNINSYKIDTELLLSDSLNISREKLIINFKDKINKKVIKISYLNLIEEEKKEPIAYIIKKKEFWKNSFYVNKDVLIPRPESEFIVEEAL